MANPRKALLNVQMMERLTQVTEDLEDIVKLTQGKKPVASRIDLAKVLRKTPKENQIACMDVYRILALYDLIHGHQVLTAYMMGKNVGKRFSVPSAAGVMQVLESIGIRRIRFRTLTPAKVVVQIAENITCRGLKGSKRPVCYFEAGLLAGLLGKFFSRKIEIQETRCCSMGDPACQYEILESKKDLPKDSPLAGLFYEGYAEENLRLLTTLASHALTAIDNTLLLEKTRRQAVIDSLTEIYNHRYFQQMIRVELRRAERHNFPLSLAMIDVDHFKYFNDHHGHPRGDHLLKQIAAMLKLMVRDIDIVSRYGGDEFSIILPQTDIDGAIRVATRIREKSKEVFAAFQHKDPRVKLGLSFGLSMCKGGKHTEPQDFIDQADKALLRAKRKGKQAIGTHYPKKIIF